MERPLDELIELLVIYMDPDQLVEALNLTTYDICCGFHNEIEEHYEELLGFIEKEDGRDPTEED